MLSIIFFALLLGFFIGKLGEKNKIFLLNTVNSGFELMMKITTFIIKFTPYGVFGIVASTVADQAGDSEALIEISKRLGLYMLTVIFALTIHSMIILPLLLKYFGKIISLNPNGWNQIFPPFLGHWWRLSASFAAHSDR